MRDNFFCDLDQYFKNFANFFYTKHKTRHVAFLVSHVWLLCGFSHILTSKTHLTP